MVGGGPSETLPLHPPCNTTVCRKGRGEVGSEVWTRLEQGSKRSPAACTGKRGGGGGGGGDGWAVAALPLAPQSTIVRHRGGRVGSGLQVCRQCWGASAPLHGVQRAREQALSCSSTVTGYHGKAEHPIPKIIGTS